MKKFENDLFIHYWQLPQELFVSLNPNFHKEFCSIVQEKTGYKFKNCFYKIINCPKWHAQRLFTKKIRFTIKELEKLSEFAGISREEIEKNLETLGNQEDGAIIRSPKLPFDTKDLFYVASHLMFDGCFRPKRGAYFYSYENSLTEYHKKRLSNFGEVPMNFLEKDNQLYFSYTIGYIASKILDINNFRSKECVLSDKFKLLAKENKLLTDEVVKSLIVDEGAVDDKIKIELANKKLVEDLYGLISIYYKLNKLSTRERKNVSFNGKWKHNITSWGFSFSAQSFKELYKSISPLPIDYKQDNLEFLFVLQNKQYFHRKHGETKKLIISSLSKQSKTIDELSKELHIKQTTISSHIKKMSEVIRVGEKILRKGGYAKVNLFGVINNNIKNN